MVDLVECKILRTSSWFFGFKTPKTVYPESVFKQKHAPASLDSDRMLSVKKNGREPGSKNALVQNQIRSPKRKGKGYTAAFCFVWRTALLPVDGPRVVPRGIQAPGKTMKPEYQTGGQLHVTVCCSQGI